VARRRAGKEDEVIDGNVDKTKYQSTISDEHLVVVDCLMSATVAGDGIVPPLALKDVGVVGAKFHPHAATRCDDGRQLQRAWRSER
jgi:anthranilate/para-aminobenzoate synthase component II